MTEETNLQTPLPDQPIDGGPETVTDDDPADKMGKDWIETNPDPRAVEETDEDADATDNDEVLETGGRTDNAGEVGVPSESQDPDVEVEGETEGDTEDTDG